MAAYEAAHPGNPPDGKRTARKARQRRVVEIDLPLVGDPALEREMEDFLRHMARQLEKLVRRS
jgi:hypothetical protein